MNFCKLYVCCGLIISLVLHGGIETRGKYKHTYPPYSTKKENLHNISKFHEINIKSISKYRKDTIKIHKKFWQLIKVVCICPMTYEYQGVLKQLESYKCSEKQITDFHLDEFRKHLSLKPDEINFFKIANNITCLILGGKCQNTISFKLGELMSILKTSLELVIIGGICGCSDTSIKIGTVMIPSHFICLDSLAICNIAENGQIKNRKHKNIISTYNEYSLHLENIKPNQYIKNNIMKILNARDCINFTSSCFIDNENFCTQLVKRINENFSKPLPHIFEMEDYAVAQACNTKQIPFICLRVVSDYAGQNNDSTIDDSIYSTNSIDNTKHLVSIRLGKTIKKLLKNLKISSNHSHG